MDILFYVFFLNCRTECQDVNLRITLIWITQGPRITGAQMSSCYDHGEHLLVSMTEHLKCSKVVTTKYPGERSTNSAKKILTNNLSSIENPLEKVSM